MDLFTFLSQNIKTILYGALFTASNIYLLHFWNNRTQLLNKRQKIIATKVLNHREALQKLTRSRTHKDQNTYLIKAYSQLKNKKMTIEKELSSNQLWLIEPSLDKIAIQIVEKLNLFHQEENKFQLVEKMKDFDIIKNLNWKLASNNKMTGQTIQVQGFGEILDHQVFKVTCEYKKRQNKFWFTTLRQNIAYYAQLILFANLRKQGKDKIKSMTQNVDRAPFITGPIIGIVKYFLQFITDRPLLIEAKFQAGRLLPLSLATSKQNIIANIDAKINVQNFNIFKNLLAIYFIYRFLSPHLKKFVKDFKSLVKYLKDENRMVQGGKQVFKMLDSSRLGENLTCIICYSNCRNTILFNCKHMIMCNECMRQLNQSHHCPLCKAQISDQKVLTKE